MTETPTTTTTPTGTPVTSTRPKMATLLMMAGAALVGGGLTIAANRLSAPIAVTGVVEESAIRAVIDKHLLEKPEIILEAVNRLEAKRRQAGAESDAKLVESLGDVLRNNPNDFALTPSGADVTIVEFLDYRCGYCKRAHSEVRALLKADPKIKFVVKEFPVLGPESVFAARASLAALKQDRSDKHLKFTDSMMMFKGALTEEVVLALAGEAGFDMTKLQADMSSGEIAQQIEDNYALGEKLNINGTPAFVIGNKLVRGFIPGTAMAQAVAEARKAVTAKN